MSTRSIIVVTGTDKYDQEKSYRLYKHYDGYPSDTLHLIAQAISECSEKMPASELTGKIIGASSNEYGMGAFLEESAAAFTPEILGNQFDLEWLYVVNSREKTVDVYGGGYTGGSPQSHYEKGTVDPLSYVNNLVQEYQSGERKRIEEQVDRIEKMRFSVNAVTA